MDLGAFGIGDFRNLASIEAERLVSFSHIGLYRRRCNLNFKLVLLKWDCIICWSKNTDGRNRVGRLCGTATQKT